MLDQRRTNAIQMFCVCWDWSGFKLNLMFESFKIWMYQPFVCGDDFSFSYKAHVFTIQKTSSEEISFVEKWTHLPSFQGRKGGESGV